MGLAGRLGWAGNLVKHERNFRFPPRARQIFDASVQPSEGISAIKRGQIPVLIFIIYISMTHGNTCHPARHECGGMCQSICHLFVPSSC